WGCNRTGAGATPAPAGFISPAVRSCQSMMLAKHRAPAAADEAQDIGAAAGGVAKQGRSQDVRQGCRNVAAASWASAHALIPRGEMPSRMSWGIYRCLRCSGAPADSEVAPGLASGARGAMWQPVLHA